MAPTKSDIVLYDARALPALSDDAAGVIEAIAENMDGEEIGARDLPRVKMPAGGGLAWEVPRPGDDPDVTKTFSGVIVAQRTTRAYFPDAYTGENNPPQCRSDDGKTGVGDPGGACATCHLAQFGSKDDGVGQACKQMRQFFVITETTGFLPLVLTLPPTSLKAARAYLLGLSSQGVVHRHIVTEIGLEKAKSGGGIEYSTVTFRAGDQLAPASRALVDEYARNLRPLIGALGRIETQADTGDPYTQGAA